jgi:hypothetical protein
VVVQDEREDRLRRTERAEHAGTRCRMPSHLPELLIGQRPALEQDRRRDDELADVVQQRTEAQHGDPLLVEAKAARHRLREHVTRANDRAYGSRARSQPRVPPSFPPNSTLAWARFLLAEASLAMPT